MKKNTVIVTGNEIVVEDAKGIRSFSQTDVISVDMKRKRSGWALLGWTVILLAAFSISFIPGFGESGIAMFLFIIGLFVLAIMVISAYMGYYELTIGLVDGGEKKIKYTSFEGGRCVADYKKVQAVLR